MKGIFHANDKFRIDLKYSKKAEEKELIKLTPLKGKSIEISADDLLSIISKHFHTKQAAMAIAEGEIGLIPMVGVLRQVYFTADRDYKLGETITTKMLHKYPYALARLEEAYGIALQHGDVTGMPNDKYQDYLKSFDEANIQYIKAVNGDVLPSGETKEVIN